MKKLLSLSPIPLIIIALATTALVVFADSPVESFNELLISKLNPTSELSPNQDNSEHIDVIESPEQDQHDVDSDREHEFDNDASHDSDHDSDNNADHDRAESVEPEQADASLVLPPRLSNFDPIPRPATSIGDPDAPVVMYEWSDYICPYCTTFTEQIFPVLKEKYIDTGKLYFVYKDFPAVGGDLSFLASVGAQCAAEQDAFWEMNYWLFSHQSDLRSAGSLSGVSSLMAGAATELGLDMETFESCFDNQSPLETIAQDYQEGQRYRVRGTPNFVVNGHVIQGMLPAEPFLEIVDALVAQAETGALPESVTEAPPAPNPSVDFIDEASAFLGDADAPVVIVEYTDYQCPFCRKHVQETMPELLTSYIESGDVFYVVKDLPLYEIHPQAVNAAATAECAGAQGAYWPMHDLLFENQQDWSGNSDTVSIFTQYATSLGLDTEAFTTCMASEEAVLEIAEDLEGGAAAGVTGTPAFFINGEFISGAVPFESLKQVIEAHLN